MIEKKRVLIGITTAETVAYQTMESIYNLDVPNDVKTELKIIHSYNVADGRNSLVNIMFDGNFDYIFFVDNDVILPKNALVDLYNMDWLISVGTYPRKEYATIESEDPYTTLYWHNERNKTIYCPTFLPSSALQKGIITPVDCCGFGCVLCKRELFNMVEQPWFFMAHEENVVNIDGNTDEYCIGEDMYFCRKLIKNGIQIWAHGSVLCGHVGTYIYNFKK